MTYKRYGSKDVYHIWMFFVCLNVSLSNKLISVIEFVAKIVCSFVNYFKCFTNEAHVHIIFVCMYHPCLLKGILPMYRN